MDNARSEARRAPRRRSHKKSKSGCLTCRERHIRCDERRPGCRNCSCHGCVCRYAEARRPSLEQSIKKVARRPLLPLRKEPPQHDQHKWVLLSTNAKNDKIQIESPKPSLPLQRLPMSERKLMHHLTVMLSGSARTNKYAIMFPEMPIFLAIAFSYDFVRQAILALSASHLAEAFGQKDAAQEMKKHQIHSLHGVRETIGRFSKETSDAVLAASLLLCWQSPNAQSFSTMTCGIATTIESMQPWKEEAILSQYARNTFAYASNMAANFGIPVPSPPPQRSEQRIWQYMGPSLEELEKHLPNNRVLTDLKILAVALQDPAARTDTELRFGILKAVQAHLHLLPLPLQIGDVRDGPFWLVLLAYGYAVTMMLTPVRYAPVSQLTRSSCVKPTEAIYHDLKKALVESGPDEEVGLRAAVDLMVIPMQIVGDMKVQLKQHERNLSLLV